MLLYNGLLYNMKKSRRINKRKKHTRRFQVRSRTSTKTSTRNNNHTIWIMKGGLRGSDCKKIGLDSAYRFNNPFLDPNIYTNLLREYMFGTKLQEDAWMNQLPHKINVSIGLNLITDNLPQNGGRFYSLGQGTTFDWLG